METKHGLPFESNFRIISQGYNGPYSHRIWKRIDGCGRELINDDRFSVDFVLPVGTPVLASKNGKILWVEDSLSGYYSGEDFEIGMRMLPNLVVIAHNDGTNSLYCHLQRGSVRAQLGDYVARGEAIAETGLSGWIGKVAHLHFETYLAPHRQRRSFPISFEDFQGSLEHSEIWPAGAGRN